MTASVNINPVVLALAMQQLAGGTLPEAAAEVDRFLAVHSFDLVPSTAVETVAQLEAWLVSTAPSH